MKKLLIIITYFLSLCGSMSAQQTTKTQQKGKENVEQQIKHYVEEFSLNGNATAQFSELFRDYSKKMHAIRTLYHKKPQQTGTTLSDSELEKRILDNFAQSRAILDVREEYYKKFRTVLSPSQINKIFEDEKARRAQMRK